MITSEPTSWENLTWGNIDSGDNPLTEPCPNSALTSERRGNNLKRFKYFYLKAKARIWPYLASVFRVRWTVDR